VPDVAVIALGGTIAMTPQASGGVVPRLEAGDLIAAVPGLDGVATLHASTFRQLPGAHLTLEDVVALAAAIRGPLGAGIDGCVVTQGTDTIEEVAFALDLLLDVPEPVVVTGAMRNPQLPGADGPANLLAAVQCAASPALRDTGTVVVLNDEVHAARLVLKRHTARPDAFESPMAGALGWVAEGRPRLALRPPRASLGLPQGARPGRVALVTTTLGDDGALVEAALESGHQAIIVEALGGGHLPAGMVPAIERAAAAVPVVLASRTQVGEVLRDTYGFPGSERDLLARGVLNGGWLNARKARVLVALLLGAGSPGGVAEGLAAYLEAASVV
jgi:L-asparaginase